MLLTVWGQPKRMIRKQTIACQETVLIYITFSPFLQKMIHFCKLTFSGDVKNCSIRLIKGKNRKGNLQLTVLQITCIFITYINIFSGKVKIKNLRLTIILILLIKYFTVSKKERNFKNILYSKFLNENISVQK